MAAALGCAARRICGRALQRPQAFFTTAAEAAVKEGRQRLLPRISHGASSIRRFTSSESATLLNNNKVPPTGGLAEQVDLTKHELLGLLRQSQGVEAAKSSSMGVVDNTELIRLIRGSNGDFFSGLHKSLAKTVAAIVATVYVETKLSKAWHRRN